MAESSADDPSAEDLKPDAGPTRLHGFSDGYFAIVITLLAIELRPPELPKETSGFLLANEIARLWPDFLAFIISFINLLILWVTHHELMRIVTRVGTGFLYLNGGLLLGIALMPFTTALIAEHAFGPGQQIAAVAYCGAYLWVAVFFNFIWAQVSRGGGKNLAAGVTPMDCRRIRRTYLITLGLYGLAFATAFAQPLLGIGLTAALGLFFAIADRLSGFASEDLARDA